MNFIKRAWLSLTRKKGKVIILFSVVFILGNLIAGAISVNQATGKVEKNIKKQLGAKATLDLDPNVYEEALANGGKLEIEPLSEETIKKIGQSDQVKYYDYSKQIYGGGKEVKPFEVPRHDESSIAMSNSLKGMEFGLKGTQYAPVMDLKEGKSKLVEGRTFTEEEIEKGSRVGLISKKLAEENNLNVGDIFIFENNVFDVSQGTMPESPVTSREVPIEIVGIFEPVEAAEKSESKDKQSDMVNSLMNTQLQNTLYVPNGVVSQEDQFQKEEQEKLDPNANVGKNQTVASYILKNPESVETFKEENAAFVPKGYKITADADQYHSIAAPIKSMSKLSQYVLFASIFAALLIISLVVLLFLRDRKHEFGVYLSLGEKRSHILGQVIIEVIAVAALAIAFSIFSGNYLAKGISHSMIQSQVQAEMEKENASANGPLVMINGKESQSSISSEDMMKEYVVSLSPLYIISFVMISLATILTATIVPIVYLLRLNPKTILM